MSRTSIYNSDCVVVVRSRKKYYEDLIASSSNLTYDHNVQIYDHMLHRTLSEIFRERRPSRAELKQLLRAPKKHTNETTIYKLIEQREGALVKLFRQCELSILWIAVLSGYEETVKLLVRSGADVNEILGLQTPHWYKLTRESTILHALLHMPPSSWNERLIALVIDHVADLEARDSSFRTALHFAASHGRVKATELLLKKGADVNAADMANMTPLLDAAHTSEAGQLLPLLLAYGAGVNVRDIKGSNVFYFLCHGKADESKKVELARVLIEKGASPRETMVTGESYQPIHHAVLLESNELVNLFLDHGANVNERTDRDTFPLYIAAEKSANPAVLLNLLKRGAKIDMKLRPKGLTPLHGLVQNSQFSRSDENTVKKIKILLSFGADMFAVNKTGSTPFDGICRRSYTTGNPCTTLVLKTLALKRACLHPSIQLKGESVIKEKYPKMWNRYRDCVEEVNRTKSTKLMKNHTLFELLTECQCHIAPLMRYREFEGKFRLCDLSAFSLFKEDILEAFESAEDYYATVLEQENLISEAFYDALPYTIVRKVVHYMHNCAKFVK